MFNAEIDTVVFDVDGTLLNSKHELLVSTIHTVRNLIEKGIFVMLATGKTYASTYTLREALGLTTMGVYVQGLVVCDAAGLVLEQRLLERSIVDEALTVADRHQLSAVAYCGSKLLTPQATETTAIMQTYHEPLPTERPGLVGESVNKLLLLGEQEKLDDIRPNLTSQWSEDARLIQAVPNMLEIVPYGSSKGATVARILRRLGRSAEHTVAFGDGENDIEMLQWAGIGVAMGNANEVVRNSADIVTKGHDHDGIAEVLGKIRFASGSR